MIDLPPSAAMNDCGGRGGTCIGPMCRGLKDNHPGYHGWSMKRIQQMACPLTHCSFAKKWICANVLWNQQVPVFACDPGFAALTFPWHREYGIRIYRACKLHIGYMGAQPGKPAE